MDEYYMLMAINEAKKALKYNEVPIGTVIVKNNKIISKAYNKIEKSRNCINHAEILAITRACKKIQNWRLDGCTLYTTVEPCMMCSGAIKQSRISKIVYGVANKKYGNSKMLGNIEIVPNVCESECKNIIQGFFQKMR